MLNAAMLSKWHVHAGGYANELKKSGKVDIKVVWDDDIERGSKWAAELGCEFEPDLSKVLAREDVEAVFCDAPTTAHKDIIKTRFMVNYLLIDFSFWKEPLPKL